MLPSFSLCYKNGASCYHMTKVSFRYVQAYMTVSISRRIMFHTTAVDTWYVLKHVVST
jgi:hypothetical protein